MIQIRYIKLLFLLILPISCINNNKTHILIIDDLNNVNLKNYLIEEYGENIDEFCGVIKNIVVDFEGHEINFDIHVNCDKYDKDISYEQPSNEKNNYYIMFDDLFIYNNEPYHLSYFDTLFDSINSNQVIDMYVISGNDNVNEKWKSLIKKRNKYPYCNFIFEYRNKVYFKNLKESLEKR